MPPWREVRRRRAHHGPYGVRPFASPFAKEGSNAAARDEPLPRCHCRACAFTARSTMKTAHSELLSLPSSPFLRFCAAQHGAAQARPSITQLKGKTKNKEQLAARAAKAARVARARDAFGEAAGSRQTSRIKSWRHLQLCGPCVECSMTVESCSSNSPTIF